jgi:hypothetical protein
VSNEIIQQGLHLPNTAISHSTCVPSARSNPDMTSVFPSASISSSGCPIHVRPGDSEESRGSYNFVRCDVRDVHLGNDLDTHPLDFAKDHLACFVV